MRNTWSAIKKMIYRIKFRLSAAEYMRVAYLTPRQVVLITTRLDSKDNVIPIDWHMPLSFFPKLYCISLSSDNFTSKIIDKTKCFAVNFMSDEFEEQILKCGRISGSETDKFELTGLDKTEAKKINVPLIKDASGWLECSVKQIIKTGDHTLFIAEIINEKMNMDNLPKQLYHVTSIKN